MKIIALVVLLALAIGVQASCPVSTADPAAPHLVDKLNNIDYTYVTTALHMRFDSTLQFDSIAFSFLDGATSTYGVAECDNLWTRNGPDAGGSVSSGSNSNAMYSATTSACSLQLEAVYGASDVAQTLAKCFIKSSDATHDIYSANVRVVTRQTKDAIRTIPITKVTSTNIRFSFRFQKTITITKNTVSVTGDFSVQSSVVEQIFNPFQVLDTDSTVLYPAVSTTVRLLTTVQYPYKLLVGSTGSASVTQPNYPFYPFAVHPTYHVTEIDEILSGETPNGAVSGVTCPNTVGTTCGQLWEVTVDQLYDVCAIDTSITFNFIVACFLDSCATSQSSITTVGYHLQVDSICPVTVEDITLGGTLSSYASDNNAFNKVSPVNQFIFGQVAYFAADLTTSAGSPDLLSSEVQSVSVKSGANLANVITFTTAPYTDSFVKGSYNAYRPSFHFEINSNTIVLVSLDHAVAVSVVATINVEYRLGTQGVASKTLQVTFAPTLQASTGMDLSTDLVVSNAAADSSSTATGSTSMLAIVAGVVGGCVFVAIVAAIVIYRRTTHSFVKELQGQSVKVMQVYVPTASSSSNVTELATMTPAANPAAEEPSMTV